MKSTAVTSPLSGPSASELQERLDSLEERVTTLAANAADDSISMVVMSGDLDHILAAFVIATGASAMYEKVTMFFTFWSIQALRDPKKRSPPKDLVGRLFARVLPKGVPGLKLSRMHMGGMGTGMLKRLMKKNNVLGLEELVHRAGDAGVQIFICQMSMDLMGFKLDEMIDYPNLKLAGVATFLAEAGTSKVSLFI